jgi:RNA polymerase sigma-70 factor (ECF subfamily)
MNDQQLLLSYRHDGNSRWVGELFERYKHLLFGVCLKYLKNREEAKDALMGVFEKLIGDLKNKEVENFPSWAYTVAKNHCLMALRKQSGQLARMEVYKKTVNGQESTDPGTLSAQDILENGLQKLELAIADLSDEQRVCVHMFYIEEKSYKEISDQTGFQLNEVKSHIQNGRRNLKIKLTASA